MESYDFIMSNGAPAKGGLNKKMRIAIVAALAIVLILGGLIINTLLSSAGKENTQTLLTIAERQTELMRVADLGIVGARSNTVQNLAVTTKLSIQSDQNAMLSVLKSNKIKTDPKKLTGRKDVKTDKALTQAEQANSFDETFTKILQTQLAEYKKDLKQAYDAATKPKTKQALSLQYTHATDLVKEEPTQ
jgi:hypothetical protein